MLPAPTARISMRNRHIRESAQTAKHPAFIRRPGTIMFRRFQQSASTLLGNFRKMPGMHPMMSKVEILDNDSPCCWNSSR